MRTAYRVLAYAILAGIAVQAMALVWADAGLGRWIMAGGVVDASLMESALNSGERPFPEVLGFMIHGVNGMFVIPLIALALMIVSFFTRQRRAIVVGVALFLGVVLQGQLGFLGHETPAIGALHGLNALLMFALAIYAARGVRIERRVPRTSDEPVSASV